MTPSRPLETPTVATNATRPCTDTEPRFERFLVRYPSGTVIESCCFIGGGATLREVEVAHPLATVEADESSRVHAGDGL
jgi:hypothetical protein